MSVQNALQFIQDARSSRALQSQILSLGSNAKLERVIEIAHSEGYDFTEAQLREAFSHDWAMRWFHQTRSPL